MDFWEIFRSVETIWLIWIASLAIFGVLFRYFMLQFGRMNFRMILIRLAPQRFHRNQSGASYSISFILILPFLVFLIALIIESSFILVAKIGTMHAAFGAARTATAWSTGDTSDSTVGGFSTSAQDKAEQAAITAMVPYASGTGKTVGYEQEATNYCRLYNDLKSSSANPKPGGWGDELHASYIMKKYCYAAAHTQVYLSLEDINSSSNSKSAPWKKYVQAEVTYDYPFHILPVGRKLLGTEMPDGTIIYSITSTAKINNECPRNEKGSLGIRILP